MILSHSHNEIVGDGWDGQNNSVGRNDEEDKHGGVSDGQKVNQMAS